MPICKMCKREVEKLVKSHIVPKSFFMAIMGESDHLVVVSSKKGEFVKKSRTGIYDQQILCLKCEEKFKIFDDYGHEILIKNKNKLVPIKNKEEDRVFAWFFDDKVDFNKINKFFLSILYRASLSNNPFFQNVSLGIYQEKIRDIIENDIEIGNEFAILIKKFIKTKTELSISFLDPRSIRLGTNNVKFYQLYLGNGYIIYIKVDKQEMPEELKQISVGFLSKMHVLADEFLYSKELDIMRVIGERII